MTPATEAKTTAIRKALDANGDETHNSHVAMLLAMLTSANKDDREHAKRRVRDLVKVGGEILADEKAAQDLAEFANRNEP